MNLDEALYNGSFSQHILYYFLGYFIDCTADVIFTFLWIQVLYFSVNMPNINFKNSKTRKQQMSLL